MFENECDCQDTILAEARCKSRKVNLQFKIWASVRPPDATMRFSIAAALLPIAKKARIAEAIAVRILIVVVGLGGDKILGDFELSVWGIERKEGRRGFWQSSLYTNEDRMFVILS